MANRGHVLEYVEEEVSTIVTHKLSTSDKHNTRQPNVAQNLGSTPLKYIYGLINYSFAPSSIRPIDGIITFFEYPVRQLSMPDDDALVLTLEVGKYLMKQILIDPGSVADLLYLPTLLCLGYKPNNLRNPRRVLVGFNGL